MPRELTCEERVLERCTDTLSDLRTMLHGVSASDCDTGELDLDSLLND